MRKERNILKAQKRVNHLRSRLKNYGIIRHNFYGKDLWTNYIVIRTERDIRLTEETITSIKKDFTTTILAKNFSIKFCMIPNKIITNKGILVRMGGGKSKPLTKVLYAPKGTPCIQIFGNSNLSRNLIIKELVKVLSRYPFLSFLFLT